MSERSEERKEQRSASQRARVDGLTELGTERLLAMLFIQGEEILDKSNHTRLGIQWVALWTFLAALGAIALVAILLAGFEITPK
jgi:hypothetical protein